MMKKFKRDKTQKQYTTDVKIQERSLRATGSDADNVGSSGNLGEKLCKKHFSVARRKNFFIERIFMHISFAAMHVLLSSLAGSMGVERVQKAKIISAHLIHP